MQENNLLSTKDGLPNYWWSQLTAVPPTPRGVAYERLKRVWFDHTGCRTWFRNPKTECHQVCTLFENMNLFDPNLWISELLEVSGVKRLPQIISACRWSYEFEDEANIKNTRPTIADIVGCARDAAGEFIFVIEAKRCSGGLKAGDSDPDYYLGSPAFQKYSRRYMLYLLDEVDLADSRVPVHHDPDFRGIFTWQQLGGLQVSLARRLPLEEKFSNFIAGAIQYQFCQHNIRPQPLAFGHLGKKDRYDQMPSQKNDPGAQSTPERRAPIWQLDWGDD